MAKPSRGKIEPCDEVFAKALTKYINQSKEYYGAKHIPPEGIEFRWVPFDAKVAENHEPKSEPLTAALTLEEQERLAASALKTAGSRAQKLEVSGAYKAQKVHARILGEYAKNWCLKVSQSLLSHHRGEENLPKPLALDLAYMFESLASGIMPEPLSDATRGKGRRGYHPLERRDIQAAIDYIGAARAGLIKDPKRLLTIQKRFKVERRQLFKWLKTFSPCDSAVADAETIKSQMEAAAERYSVCARTSTATKKRGRSDSKRLFQVISTRFALRAI